MPQAPRLQHPAPSAAGAPARHASLSNPANLTAMLAVALLAGLLLAAIGWACTFILPDTDPQELAALLQHFPPGAQSVIKPEPVERALYVISVLLAPAAILAAAWVIARFAQRLSSSQPLISPAAKWLATAVTLELLYLLWFTRGWGQDCGLVGPQSLPCQIQTVLVLLLFALTACRTRLASSARPRSMLTIAAVAFALLVLFSGRVCNLAEIMAQTTLQPAWHLSPVLYALSLGTHGHAFHTGGAPQYGFYGYLLAPLFKLTGISVLSFLLVMFLLLALAYLALLFTTFRVIRSTPARIILTLSLAAIMGGVAGLFPDGWDIYVQYFPLRFIAPVAAVVLLCGTLRQRRYLRAAIGSLLLGVIAFLNLDGGITACLAFIAAFTAIAAADLRSHGWHTPVLRLFAISMLGLALGLAATLLLLTSSPGAPARISDWFASQRLFYASGYFMLPMPRGFHAWWFVAAVYLAGLAHSLVALFVRPPHNPRTVLTLILSILGCGLFSYYQGRSADSSLLAPSWPALVLVVIALDALVCMMHLRHLSATLLPASLLLAFVPLCMIGSLLAATPTLPTNLTRAGRSILGINSSLPELEAARDFVAEARAQNQTIFVNSHRYQGEFMAELDLDAYACLPSLHEIATIEAAGQLRNLLDQNTIDQRTFHFICGNNITSVVLLKLRQVPP